MRATHGTAIYTGGGFYICIGELDNGNYFVGGMDCIEIVNADPRIEIEDFDGWKSYGFDDIDWILEHEVEATENGKESNGIIDMFKDFCKRIDNREPNLTDGYEDFSNYCSGEVYEMMLFDQD